MICQLHTEFAYCHFMTVSCFFFFPFHVSADVSCLQDYVNNQVGGNTKWTFPSLLHLFVLQYFCIHLSMCLCVFVCAWMNVYVSHSWYRHLLFRNRQCWGGGAGNFEAATHMHMTLWVANRKGANCGINRCMLGTTTDWQTNWGRGV